MSAVLPKGFEALEPYVGHWAAESIAVRAELRGTSNIAERTAFYDVAAPLAVSALDYLDTRGMAHFDASDKRLMDLMLSFAHVSIAIEIQREDEEAHALARNSMRITFEPSGRVFD